jgi:hypothetical protein
VNQAVLEAVDALVTGDRKKARRILQETSRQDFRDPDVWLLLAALSPDEAVRAKCRDRIVGLAGLPQPQLPEHYEPLEVPVAAVNKEDFPANVAELRLREVLTLRREPDNAYDGNAIRVERYNRQGCGYIRRDLAAVLAPEMDRAQQPLFAVVTVLDANFYDDKLALKIAIALPDEIRECIRSELQALERPLRYLYESTAHHLYILLECTERKYAQVKAALADIGLEQPHSGISDRTASNGQYYSWFVRVEPESGLDEAAIEKFFAERFNTISDREQARRASEQAQQTRDELLNLQAQNEQLQQYLNRAQEDQENLWDEWQKADEAARSSEGAREALDNRLSRMQNRIANLQNEIERNELQRQVLERSLAKVEARERAVPRSDTHDSELKQAISCLLPDVVWCDGSLDVLIHEYRDWRVALEQVYHICHDPQNVPRTKRVRSTRNWWELHVSTGEDDDGRLYYLWDAPRLHVLLSYKKYQKSDIAKLRAM